MSVFTVNHNPGADTVHVEHPWEVCNTDQAEDLETVDEATGRALVASGAAAACEHCAPFGKAADAPD